MPTCRDADSVKGGLGRAARSIRAIAAVQLPWQSRATPMMPPLMMPGNAWKWLGNRNLAWRPFSARKLASFRPRSAEGPATG